MTLGRTISRVLMVAAVMVAAPVLPGRIAAGGVLGAQTAAEHIAAGDRLAAAFDAPGALAEYEKAIAADSTSYEALWKAAKSAVDIGEADRDQGHARAIYKKGEGYARRAVKANPSDAEGHFHLARSLGRTALSMGPRDKVKYAVEIRDQALEALKHDPRHPGALHVMGMWNAEVMRLNGFERFFAKNVLGGKVFGSASWKDAASYLERAVESDPERAVHRLDLGEIYLDMGNKAKARAQFDTALTLPRMDYNDPEYKRKVEAALARIK
jgi:tetratricopeptide (TPR) repeat protein